MKRADSAIEEDIDCDSIRVGDLVRYLSTLARLHRLERIGNSGLESALRLLADRLRPHRDRPVGDLKDLIPRTTSILPTPDIGRGTRVELPTDLANLAPEAVVEIIEDDRVLKSQIVELGASRFAISRSRLARLPRTEAIATIRSALEHDRSLEVIAQRAQRAGERRSQ